MRPQPPLLAGASVRRPSASCPGEWQEALSLPNPRAEHPLFSRSDPSPDLFICAKDLFVEANDGSRGSNRAGNVCYPTCWVSDLPETFLERSDTQRTYADDSSSISGRDVQAIFFRRRHQPRRPPPAKIRPGRQERTCLTARSQI